MIDGIRELTLAELDEIAGGTDIDVSFDIDNSNVGIGAINIASDVDHQVNIGVGQLNLDLDL
jgi:hypothetical protein